MISNIRLAVLESISSIVRYAQRNPTFFDLRFGAAIMSHFRRAYVPGGSFFFTVVTERRAPILCTDSSRIFLRTAIRECSQRWPFRIDAMVLLDVILTLLKGDARYSERWGWVKKELTKAVYLSFGGN